MTEFRVGDFVEHISIDNAIYIVTNDASIGIVQCRPANSGAGISNMTPMVFRASSLRLLPDVEFTRLIEEARRDKDRDR